MKTKIGILLAVTLATTTPALASPKAHPAITRPKPAETKPVAAKPVAPKPIAARPIAAKPVVAPTPAMQPRTLPSGAPACGNVQSKGARMKPCDGAK
jgi:hypothetical protein